MGGTVTADGFDRRAAVTRSMLGWGVVAGPFSLVFGLILALTRPGFELRRDALSLLLLGELGWLQWLNLAPIPHPDLARRTSGAEARTDPGTTDG